MDVKDIIRGILQREGSVYKNRMESGRMVASRWGVTADALSAWRGHTVTDADVEALSGDEAMALYMKQYVDAPGFGALLPLSNAVAVEVIDTGVNMGQATAAKLLQRCLNVFNHNGKDYPDLTVDGNCGPGTAAALAAFMKARGADGEKVLLRALNSLQGSYYIGLTEQKPDDEDFIYGWILQRVSM